MNFSIKKFLEISGGTTLSITDQNGVCTDEKMKYLIRKITFSSKMFKFGEKNNK